MLIDDTCFNYYTANKSALLQLISSLLYFLKFHGNALTKLCIFLWATVHAHILHITNKIAVEDDSLLSIHGFFFFHLCLSVIVENENIIPSWKQMQEM